jgi:DNA-binding Lrp family transcriptional regulator
MALAVKSNYELSDILTKIRKKIKYKIQDFNVLINLNDYSFPIKYILNSSITPQIFSDYVTDIDNFKIYKLNKTERKILEILRKNPTTKISDIIKSCGMTYISIKNKISLLEQQGIIKRFSIFVNVEKLGYSRYLCLLKLNPSAEYGPLIEFAKYHPNIIFLSTVLGSWDMILDIHVKNLADLHGIMHNMKEKFDKLIKENQYLQIYKEIKKSPVIP